MKHFNAAERPAKDEICNLRERLYDLARMADGLVIVPASRDRPMPASEKRVRAILKARRTRNRFFDPELFADPAWDILLELYASDLGQRRMSVSSLCLGANVPATTALRWIKALEGKGLIARRNDPTDGRRVFVSLSAVASDLMDQLFAANPQTEALI